LQGFYLFEFQAVRSGIPLPLGGLTATKTLLFAPCLMVERGLSFTRRRPQITKATPDPPLLTQGSPSPNPPNPARSRLIYQGSPMPEVIFTGPAGRIEGRYHPAKQKNAPIAMVLHPHPQFAGTMNHQIIYQCYYAFVHRGFSVLRFNFRGVGRSQGSFDHGTGELSDAAAALDWAQTINPEARACWVAGFSFGAWIGMQLLMRRPEVEGFISIAPPANLYDFSFLAPCPSSGLIVHGEKDAVVPPKDVNTLVEKLKTQKGIVIDQHIIPGANHFFDGKLQPLMESVTGYLDMRLANVR
jgi:alpha/beta superfamily hydrolase